MSSEAYEQFSENKADVDRLWEIHAEVAGDGVGRKHGVDVLNRAAVVLITSCWEAYVEDVALEGFDFLLDEATSADMIPNKVQALVGESVRASESRLAAWELADQGWRKVLRSYRDKVKQTWLDEFNTPKTEPVDKLFERVLGLRQLSSNWTWRGMSSEQAGRKLDKYIKIRGQIVHRVQHDERVYKRWGANYLDHIARLVEATEKATNRHLHRVVGTAPW